LPTDTRDLALQIFEVLYGGMDASALDEVAEPDLVVHHVGSAPLRGVALCKGAVKSRVALPGEKYRIECLVADGEYAAIRWTMDARCPLGIPDRSRVGEPCTMVGASFIYAPRGKAAEVWTVSDVLGLFRQLDPGLSADTQA
jgi:predicted ester cyclase